MSCELPYQSRLGICTFQLALTPRAYKTDTSQREGKAEQLQNDNKGWIFLQVECIILENLDMYYYTTFVCCDILALSIFAL